MATKTEQEKMTFVIGDVLGMARHLEVLYESLVRHAARAGAEARMVFLGNVIGSGPLSDVALDRVDEIIKAHPGSALIMGERDYMLHRLLEGKMTQSEAQKFARNSGPRVFESYGLSGHHTLEEKRDAILASRPAHRELLRNAKKLVVEGDYCFTHCGIRLGVPIEKQTAKDMRSFNGDFLYHSEPHQKILVHGRVSCADHYPAVFHNRISINTSVDVSRRLTALVLEGGRAKRFAIAKSLDEGNADDAIVVTFWATEKFIWEYHPAAASAV